ncbi:UDP-2,4-diacetamido-2,4,6-trideoxy-beta-L-altropyranose hydrolase [Castellaniella sp.]|uniref:UDP-2,4-diacetamido-2,4, 6-trideoxy-beta-L-altropyranose hydrolase n=1 Tax=Castellaniella sp. TaxID=1955812 RepID=UPI002AFF1646|nr:UDP-2,4-diacetamido-2,4,6-trideoxy-beta-L-altropyranose hydrolase [Castellaniella sp.]
MKVFIRVDASIDIGTGHVMRCLVLADQLRARGAIVYFICRAHVGHMIDSIVAAGYQVFALPMQVGGSCNLDVDSFLGESFHEDALSTAGFLRDETACWVVVDHHSIDWRWESLLKQEISGMKLMVIDGYANRSHVCDLLLDQTYSPEGLARWSKLVPSECRILAGPEYALLRPEFSVIQKITEDKKIKKMERFFVSFGGIDKPNATLAVVDMLSKLFGSTVVIDVLLGKENPHIAKIKHRYTDSASVKLHVQPDNVAVLMEQADLAITAGGTTVWELCALRVPMLIISIADNQVDLAKNMDLCGGAVYLGAFTGKLPGSLRSRLEGFRQDVGELKAMRKSQEKLMPNHKISIGDYMVGML